MLVSNFSKSFFEEKSKLRLSAPMYDFVSETVILANLIKTKQAKVHFYSRLLVEPCCQQIIASGTPP